MQVVRSQADLAALARDPQPSVVSVGNFDGVHRGHRKVIDAVNARARELGARSVVVTFDPHPAQVLGTATGEPLRLLTPTPQKLDLLAATGVDLTLVLPFTPELSLWSAERFAREIFHDLLQTVEIREGETFRFGHKAAADIAGLAALGPRPRLYLPRLQARWSCAAPRSPPAAFARWSPPARSAPPARCSAAPSASRSTPASGRGYGTLYTVPTINLAPYPELLPAHGVYITTLRVGEGPSARVFQGITNSGNRPTFGADSFAVETQPARLPIHRPQRNHAHRADLPPPRPRRAPLRLPRSPQAADRPRRSAGPAASSPSQAASARFSPHSPESPWAASFRPGVPAPQPLATPIWLSFPKGICVRSAATIPLAHPTSRVAHSSQLQRDEWGTTQYR